MWEALCRTRLGWSEIGMQKIADTEGDENRNKGEAETYENSSLIQDSDHSPESGALPQSESDLHEHSPTDEISAKEPNND